MKITFVGKYSCLNSNFLFFRSNSSSVVKFYHGKEQKFHIFFVVDQGSVGFFQFETPTKKLKQKKIMRWAHGQFRTFTVLHDFQRSSS